MELDKKAYAEYVKEITPTHPLGLNMLKAFLTGGLICLIGQVLTNGMIKYMGIEDKSAAVWTAIGLIILSVIFTGFNIYPRIVKWGGAGALVPITGFANSVVAPAVEYKSEGWVYGVGCKIFTIAGPVILYGILSSWVLGLITWLFQVL